MCCILMLSISGKNSALLTVHGTCKWADNKPGTFVQTFALHLPDLILSDSLVVKKNAPEVPEVSSPNKSQDHTLQLQSQNHCGICNKKWHPLDRDWVCCDRCQMWLHVECDPNCSRDMKKVQMSEYFCPLCTSVCKDVMTLKSTSKKKSLEPIIVLCAGKEGFFKREEDKIECRCEACLKSPAPRMMSMNVWEKHTGSRQKNWKKSIKLNGTEKTLFKFLQETPDGTGITSIASEILQVSSVDASYQPAAETSDQPTAVTSDQPAASISCAMSGNKSQKSKVCILHDYDRMKSHQDEDIDHVDEKAARLSEIMNTLKQDGVMDRTETEPFDSADYEIVLTAHDRILLDYVDKLPMTDEEQEAIFFEVAGMSVFSSEGTTEAIKAAGSDLVVEDYYETAFAIIRPPGHHAHRSKAEGFCFLNNIAIAAQHIINHHHKERILVVDFDVHHGNGTQGIFYQRMDLFYPESDSSTEDLGEGLGFGYNINVPLRKGFDDVDMLYVCDVLLSPVATEFNPEVVLVSAGYDAAKGDAMGGCNISAKGFGTIVRKLLHLSHGKMVLALEGGYDLVQLPICVSHTIRAILGDEDAFLQDSDYRDKRVHETTISTVNTLKHNLRLCWDVFKEKHSGPSPEAQAPLPAGGLGAGPGDAGIGCSSYVTST